MTNARDRLGSKLQNPSDRLRRLVMRLCTALAAPAVLTVASQAFAVGFQLNLDGSGDPSPSTGSAPDATADQSASSESISYDEREANPAHYEIGFVSMGAYQAWAIAGRWLYFGIGGGLGPPLYRYSKLDKRDAGWDPTLDIVYANAFLRLAPIPYIDLDVGPKIAVVSTLYDVEAAPQAGFAYGAYADLRIGSKTIKLGPRFEYERVAYSSSYDKGWRITPLMLRIVH